MVRHHVINTPITSMIPLDDDIDSGNLDPLVPRGAYHK
jgi:hypothetical protein